MTVPRAERKPFVVAAGLFFFTFLVVLIVGADSQLDFLAPDAGHLPPSLFSETGRFLLFLRADPSRLLLGLPYALTLMAILLLHELGHYFACRRHGVVSTPPYFVPAPTIIGTFGAFIKIRSPFPSKRALFDIGVAGPLAGFAATVPLIALGIHLSKLVPADSFGAGGFRLGEPLLFSLLARLIKGAAAGSMVLRVHPVAFAGWFGLLATAFNLFPIGQLDGGHILYAALGRRAYPVGVAAVAALLVLGAFAWTGWLLWALLVTLIGLRHPPVFEYEPLDRRRRLLALAALLVFVLSFTPAPVSLAG